MNLQDVPIFGHTVDKSEIPPIHQKRILAFVNHFIIKTCTFLNDFALKCESKFIDAERQLQKVEASLVIIESKLSSISGLDNKENNNPSNTAPSQTSEEEINKEPQSNEHTPEEIQGCEDVDSTVSGVRACEDARYKKYFKMVQFGVPANAVKMKMETEGFDPNILNNPDITLPEGIPCDQPAT